MERQALPTLRQLAYLVELSERLNFRVAAEEQLVTQSTLSAGIKELETLLGVQLVERDNRNVRLTAVGEDVVARARELLAAATDLAEAARAATRPCPVAALGRDPTIAPTCYRTCFPRWRATEPEAHLREDLTKRLLERLRAAALTPPDRAALRPGDCRGELYRTSFRSWRAKPSRGTEKEVALRKIDPANAAPGEGHCLRNHAIAAAVPGAASGVPRRGHEPDHPDPWSKEGWA